MDNPEIPESSLLDSIELKEDSPLDKVSDFSIEIVEKSLTEFQRLQQQYTTAQTPLTIAAKFLIVSKEEYIRNTAFKLYAEIHRAAKLFLKNWCIVNKMRQKWSSPFERAFSARYLKNNAAFIPQVYTLSVVSVEAEFERTLSYMAKTAREASINGAKSLGFDDSTERKVALSKFPPDILEVILKDPSYLREQESLYIYEEHRKQIEGRKYVKSYIRDNWIKEVDEQFSKRNGVI
jgi:hypothetical protein